MSDTPERKETAEGEQPSVVRYEEEVEARPERVEDEVIRLRKTVESHRIDESVPFEVQYGDIERTTAKENDSGEIETLPDGSISIPILEEQVFVTKRTVVRERIIVRKRVERKVHRIEETVQREHVDVEGPEGSYTTAERQGYTAPLPGSSITLRQERHE